MRKEAVVLVVEGGGGVVGEVWEAVEEGVEGVGGALEGEGGGFGERGGERVWSIGEWRGGRARSIGRQGRLVGGSRGGGCEGFDSREDDRADDAEIEEFAGVGHDGFGS